MASVRDRINNDDEPKLTINEMIIMLDLLDKAIVNLRSNGQGTLAFNIENFLDKDSGD